MDIKATIKKQGFALQDVAKKMSVSYVSFYKTINGNPTIETLRKIANIIGCNVTDFFLDEVQETPKRENPDGTIICPHCGKVYGLKAITKDGY